MSSTEKNHKTAAEHAAQIEKMHRHIAEVCDRESRESVHQWHHLRQEHATQNQLTVGNEEIPVPNSQPKH